MQSAPYYADLTTGPAATAYWLDTADGVRIRMGVWPPGGSKGTVLMFPGRTEYVEKYADLAGFFADQGLSSLAVDWRGQGLADRLLPDRMKGYVGTFAQYQLDIAAVVDLATQLDLPRPWHLMAHSMGGCIGYRWLLNGADVASAMFSAPMWGVHIAPHLRPFAPLITRLGVALGGGENYAPSTGPKVHTLEDPFEGNSLTNNREEWAKLGVQMIGAPDLRLGGPTIHWFQQASVEMALLRQATPPSVPTITSLGSEEKVVSSKAIRDVMAKWTGGELLVVPGGKHEIWLETDALRDPIAQATRAHFAKHT